MASLTQNGNKNGGVPQLSEDISIGSGLGGLDDGIELNGGASLVSNPSEEELEKQKRHQEYQEELAKIQEDIATLRLVLNDKLKRETELKNLLGVTFVAEIKQDFAESFSQIKSSNVYQKTSAGLQTATQKITPAFSSIGGTLKNSFGNLKNSSMFKSFEAGIGSTLNTVQGRMKNSQSEYVNAENNLGNNGEEKKMTTSHSTLGTTSDANGTNGSIKHETIPEDKERS